MGHFIIQHNIYFAKEFGVMTFNHMIPYGNLNNQIGFAIEKQYQIEAGSVSKSRLFLVLDLSALHHNVNKSYKERLLVCDIT